MTKKKFIYILGAVILMSSCKKSDPPGTTPDTNLGYVSFTNANASSKTINVVVDGAQVNPTAIGVNATLTGTYAGFAAGTRALVTRDAVTPADLFTGNMTIEKGKSYSFFQYGVLTGGLLKGIVLNTDRAPDANLDNAKVRFLNLSNGAPALDFIMVRQEGTTIKDSVLLFSGVPSLATVVTPDIAALSVQKAVAGNKAANSTPGVAVSSYIIRIKLASTNTIVASTAATTIVPGRNYTFYARGNYPSAVLSSVLDN